MKTTHRTDILARGLLAGGAVTAAALIFLSYAMAGPVVQSLNQGTSGDRPQDGSLSVGLPGADVDPWSLGLAIPPETDTTSPRQRPRPSTIAPPSSGAAPSAGGQQPTTYQPGYQPAPGGMPIPPTYAPGSPGAPANSNVNPYGQMPLPPTASGTWDSPTSNAMPAGPAMVQPGVGGGGMGMMPRGSLTSGGLGGSTGYGGYGVPPAPTPSVGGAALADPRFGRFETQSIREATAPRQSAAIGQSQSQILSGEKPFANYRAPSAYSPYMRLSQDLSGRVNPGVNTYYDWVKPLLDQQQQNRQVNRSVQGLTETARTGYQSLESLKQRPGSVIQGTSPRVPATFMNTGQYYPGFGRPRGR